MKKLHLCLVNSVPLELKVGSGAEVNVALSTFLEIRSHPEKPEGHLTIPGNHPLKVSNQFMCHKCVLSRHAFAAYSARPLYNPRIGPQ